MKEAALLLAAALIGPTAACGSGGSAPPAARPRPAEYRIGIEDVVEVQVWKEEGLNTTQPVRPDGKITVPMVGDLIAAGKTARQLEQEIAAVVAKTVMNPVVNVSVKEINAGRVYVTGEVARPGVYPLRGEMTLIQAIAQAGGLTEFADEDDIVILRPTEAGKQERVNVDFDDAVESDEPWNLYPGDTVIVR